MTGFRDASRSTRQGGPTAIDLSGLKVPTFVLALLPPKAKELTIDNDAFC
jgi:hypothetical protein